MPCDLTKWCTWIISKCLKVKTPWHVQCLIQLARPHYEKISGWHSNLNEIVCIHSDYTTGGLSLSKMKHKSHTIATIWQRISIVIVDEATRTILILALPWMSMLSNFPDLPKLQISDRWLRGYSGPPITMWAGAKTLVTFGGTLLDYLPVPHDIYQTINIVTVL